MTMASNAYKVNNNTELQIVKILISGFTGSLKGWWDSYVTPEEKEIILNAKKTHIKKEIHLYYLI
ncbi:reverse transcriptase domain, Zinc finger, CCHC-type, Aspartic peptidase domain protein [Artemisia annua]|uniref:Reverse transcriptase domain, Zinc finger, CCHC-type, Aspartic peptidase domain protein n=1 Tax=Artemisia annua TaxID=35608 RepID=A0A2U1L024_ARTAN|nr:reverse transcriptase domain, Zinc finger, CCHC-type, Aspartic peptidase domain protein [Artemisia annua]